RTPLSSTLFPYTTLFRSDILYLLWHSPGAYQGYNTPELDALLEETRTTSDPEARLAVVQEVMRHLLEEAVHVPVYSPGWLWMYADRKSTRLNSSHVSISY